MDNYNIPIEEVKWISKEALFKLKLKGFTNLFQLAMVSAIKVDQCGISGEEAYELVVKARRAVEKLHHGREFISNQVGSVRISTGSHALDRTLGDGVITGGVTCILGSSGTGKTQFCFQLALNVQLPEEDGGLSGEVVFVDSLGTFRPERLAEMASHRGLNIHNILEKIQVVKVRSSQEQIEILPKVRKLLKEKSIRLLVIDTLTDNFLQYPDKQEKFIRRQSQLAKYLHDLALLALRENIAVVVTNTVRSKFTSEGSVQIETGGLTVAQGTHVKISLSEQEGHRKAELIYPLNGRAVCFKIEASGISDC